MQRSDSILAIVNQRKGTLDLRLAASQSLIKKGRRLNQAQASGFWLPPKMPLLFITRINVPNLNQWPHYGTRLDPSGSRFILLSN
jgi:hypothetical protein